MTQAESAAVALPVGEQASSLSRSREKASRRAKVAWQVVRHVASVVSSIALGVVALYALLDRRFDLGSFLLALLVAIAVGLLIWRLHALWLVLDEPERIAGSHQRDPLARMAGLPLWRDRLFLALFGASWAANSAIFGYVSDRYATLPPFLPLHYSATGDVDRLGTPPEVFMMPAIGLITIAANAVLAALLYRSERFGALLLVGAGIFVQIVLFVATINIVLRA